MAPSPSADDRLTPFELTPTEAETLLDQATDAILDALLGEDDGPPIAPLPPERDRPRGAFVTLKVDGHLNGCIGSIEGEGERLTAAVRRLALAAAFRDPRLPPLRVDDLDHLTIEVSILSPLVPLDVHDRAGLIAALRPGVDGLVIDAASGRALFLPQVWDDLPEPGDFLDALWRKAGFPAGSWPRGMQAFRFTVDHHERRLRR